MKDHRSNFEHLRIYHLSESLADLVWNIVSRWEWFARKTIGQQIVRAADSIGANIAEGVGRGTFADQRRFIFIARGSINETKHWLRRAWQRKLLDNKQTEELQRILQQLAPMLNAYINSLNRLNNSSYVPGND